MGEEERKYVGRILKDKKLRLQHVKEEHRKAIAVYEAQVDMLTRDIDMFEGALAEQKQK